MQHDDFRYNLKRANWEKFDQEIKKVFDSSLKDKLAFLPARDAVLVTKEIQKVCRRTMGIRRNCGRGVPWWREELSILRKTSARSGAT